MPYCASGAGLRVSGVLARSDEVSGVAWLATVRPVARARAVAVRHEVSAWLIGMSEVVFESCRAQYSSIWAELVART